MTAPRLQLVVAHPDDETFGCGSLLLHAAAGGATTAVVCATRGEAGEIKEGSGVTPAGLGTAREAELREAARILEVSKVDVLGFGDSGMNGDAAVGTLVGAPFDDVVAAVRAQVEAFAPDILVTLDGSDGHRDHARIRDAALAVARELAIPRVYLHCLPRSLMQQWFQRMHEARPDTEHLEAPITEIGTPEDQITTVIDSATHLPTREAAIAAHASQSSPFEALPDDLRRAFLTAEYLQRVTPAWTGGPKETHLLR